MEIDWNLFWQKDRFTVIANFPKALKDFPFSHSYVIDEKYQIHETVKDFLKQECHCSDEKIISALGMVHFSYGKDLFLDVLTSVETRKVRLIFSLLKGEKNLVLEHFFEELIFEEREYFKRLFRNFMYKKGMQLILLENNMNFVCETVKDFFLYTKNRFVHKDDFYDEEIYQYVEMPYTISLVKYFESCGHKIDHDVTFSETLKAIYRGVS